LNPDESLPAAGAEDDTGELLDDPEHPYDKTARERYPQPVSLSKARTASTALAQREDAMKQVAKLTLHSKCSEYGASFRAGVSLGARNASAGTLGGFLILLNEAHTRKFEVGLMQHPGATRLLFNKGIQDLSFSSTNTTPATPLSLGWLWVELAHIAGTQFSSQILLNLSLQTSRRKPISRSYIPLKQHKLRLAFNYPVFPYRGAEVLEVSELRYAFAE
jgi:hypothetical protein